MSALTIRLPNNVVEEVNIQAKKLHISRSEYIRKSIEYMNKQMYEKERKKKLIEASKKVRKESVLVNSEFARIENDPES